MDRRLFVSLGASAMAGASLPARPACDAPSAGLPVAPVARADRERAGRLHTEAMAKSMQGNMAPKVVIGMLVYPGMYLQDLVGPLSVFEALMNRDIHLLWKDKQVVGSGKPEWPALIPVAPTTAFADCPEHLDVLFVPGGVPGTQALMDDDEVLAFLADKGAKATYVTSVCTGSLILGAAGLLKGYRATSHWTSLDPLKLLGATPVHQRVVQDRNRITGAGVTAGFDLALTVAAKVTSVEYAKTVQLYLEYDPEPPFDSGSPRKASPKAVREMSDMFAGLNDWASAAAKRRAATW